MNQQTLSKILLQLERQPDPITLSGGLTLKIQAVHPQLLLLHAGRIQQPPSPIELETLQKAIHYTYKPSFILQTTSPQLHRRYHKHYIIWPKSNNFKLSWKRPTSTQPKLPI